MRCPSCRSELSLEGGADLRCPRCGWEPQDLLARMMEDIERARSGRVASITDPSAAARSLAYSGQGAAIVLAQLGLLRRGDWLQWSKRFLDAAGIAYEEIEIRMDASFQVEAHDEPEADDDTDPEA